MKKVWVLGVAAAFCAGAGLGACGGGATGTGSSNTGATEGAGGKTTTSSSTAGTGGGGLGFDSGPNDSAAPDGDACGSVVLMQHLTPGNIVVVFDQSSSMGQPFVDADAGAGDAGVGGPKWTVARDALVTAVTPDQGILNLGAIFFPTGKGDGGCSLVDPIGTPPQIPIEPGAMFVTDFQGHFSAPGWKLIGGTPLKDALVAASVALPSPPPTPGKRAVVILTDGAPTCDTVTADILAPVQAMFTHGIRTYAVGLPGSAGAATLLDDIAMAGGTTSYLSPGDAATLETALAKIATDTLDQCTITLDPPPSDPTKVHLIVTDVAHPKGYEIFPGDGGDGWSLSPDGTTVTLEGAVCTKATKGGYTSIQFQYGCADIPH